MRTRLRADARAQEGPAQLRQHKYANVIPLRRILQKELTAEAASCGSLGDARPLQMRRG